MLGKRLLSLCSRRQSTRCVAPRRFQTTTESISHPRQPDLRASGTVETGDILDSLPLRSPPRQESDTDGPRLKRNVWASNFTVTEADVDQSLEQEINPRVSASGESGSSESDSVRDARPRSRERYTTLSEPRTIELSDLYRLEVHLGYVDFVLPLNERHHPMTYSSLRDNCLCARCRHFSTRQKLHTSGQAHKATTTTSFAREIQGVETVRQSVVNGETGLEIIWDENHRSFYPLGYIRSLAYSRPAGTSSVNHYFKRRPWFTSDHLTTCASLRVPFVEFAAGGIYNVLSQLQRFGIVILEGVPTDPTSDEECMLRKVIETIGEIRNTFYGETWDVKTMEGSKNVAYTNLDLGLHMDLLYFRHPPRFQALHCLRNRVEGGASYFLDSFAAAHYFARIRPEAAKLLIETKLWFEYENDDHHLAYSRHVFPKTLAHLDSAVNWSPPFQSARSGAVTQDTREGMAAAALQDSRYLDALREWERILRRPKSAYEFTMREGDLVLFDNQRVLHARRAFRDLTEEEKRDRGVDTVQGEPTRWLKGCYVDGDVVYDKLNALRMLRAKEGVGVGVGEGDLEEE